MELKTLEALEQVVGSRPLPVLMKSIDTLDVHCVRLLARSPFAVLGFADADGRARAWPVGGAPGFAHSIEGTHLRFTLPEPAAIDVRTGCSLLFFVPGLGETLRVNGRPSLDGAELTVTVEEAFMHCAKSILRSSLWEKPVETSLPLLAARSGPLADAEVLAFLSHVPFVTLTSWDAQGAGDTSPKGDPPGFLKVDAQGRLAVADRPGNRRADTFHNLLEQPRVALLAFRPGDDRVVELSGRASLTTEPTLLSSMAVENKTPKLSMLLDVEFARLVPSAAVRDAELWNTSRHVPRSELPKMAEICIDHLKLNKQKGLAASAVRALASKTVVGWALEQDYEKNRY
ncbi:pyridoxamine 5'-phosphate oxidase family protein [Polyangium mundeleinium]|uniref:Pyridoxamine 5'-phosphate oxidase family protein n=1 Tax=Polyangium mundeleinium TaxID=2995306 RepID=A0ABT5F077_9BACT|nr:pyridoxamine 5'-phosphate oxidase family protein [Polyangium mundeleinium]MDC0746471.1 pyridoxamine 5'-phosphate oxidase family protein [Polyangium mundeleinium]